MYQFSIEFEYNEAKSQANQLKHGLSLEEAKLLWKGIGVETKSFYPTEMRWLRIGILDGKFHTRIFTYRDKRVRIISFRRSAEREIKKYGEVFNYEKKET